MAASLRIEDGMGWEMGWDGRWEGIVWGMGYGVWGMVYPLLTHSGQATSLSEQTVVHEPHVFGQSLNIAPGFAWAQTGGWGSGGVGWPITDTFTAHVSTQ